MSNRFMIFVIDDYTGSSTPEEESAIDRFNDELRAADQLITMGGYVYPPTVGVIDNRNGANIETGKPLFDGPEKYSGFWLVTATDLEEARTLALKGSKACNRKVELRQLH